MRVMFLFKRIHWGLRILLSLYSVILNKVLLEFQSSHPSSRKMGSEQGEKVSSPKSVLLKFSQKPHSVTSGTHSCRKRLGNSVFLGT